MKTNIQRSTFSLKLSILSNIIILFLHEEKNSCGNKTYGLPADMIHSFCSCAEHAIPISITGLAINLTYHFVIWFSVFYLWQDSKETWAMFYKEINN